MKLATTTGDFAPYTKSQIDAIEYIHKAGFRYIDYNFCVDYSDRSGVFCDDYLNYLCCLKKTSENLGIKFVQSHAPMGTLIGPAGEQLLADTIRCVEACATLGIPNIVVHSGYAKGLSAEETFEVNKRFFVPLLETAQRYGVDILVENFNKMCIEGLYWIDNATDLKKFIEYVDHPGLYAVWDAGHANMQEMQQEDELKILGKYVRALHIQDNPGNSDSHMMPFYGSLNIDSLMRGLEAIDYKGYFTFESNSMLFRCRKGESPYGPRLKSLPIEARVKEEELLYRIGKSILSAYNCYEE